MGAGRWDDGDWSRYKTSHVSGKTTDAIYSSKTISENLNPKGVKFRESRDSEKNPVSTAVIVGLDVTGSMDPVLDIIVREGLNTFMTEIYNRKPVSDPHLMIMGIGDVEWDQSPLQVTQFEGDIRIAEQLKNIFFERGGGGNSYESYILAWYFAAYHTSIDCFEKRGKKGYLFTVGDEEPTPFIKANYIEKFIGDNIKGYEVNAKDLLAEVSKTYNVYHIMVEEGNHFSRYGKTVAEKWLDLLGQHALKLKDHKSLAEVIVSTIQAAKGEDKNTIIESWKGSKSTSVKEAIKNIPVVEGLVRF